MRLYQVLSNLSSSIRSAQVALKTSSHLATYRKSAGLKYARLYGYHLKPGGPAEIVFAEAEVVRLVIESFAAGRSVSEVKKELDKRGLRNRSGKRWSIGEVMTLVRPIYAGVVKGPLGTSRRSTVYPPIVQQRTLKLAQKALKREVENASRPSSRRPEGGRQDASIAEAVLGVGEALKTCLQRVDSPFWL